MDRNHMKVGDTVQLIRDVNLGESYPWKKDTNYTVTKMDGDIAMGLDGIRCCLQESRFRIMKTQIERVKELAKEFADDSMVLGALKTKYPKAFEQFTWRIKISDGYGPAFTYAISDGRGDTSIAEVAGEVARFLKGTLESSHQL